MRAKDGMVKKLFLRKGMDELHPPPQKCQKCSILNFFHMFFAISFRVRSNTYSKVIILYPKGNSRLLNTFLTLFWWKIHFCVLSATSYENCLLKNAKKKSQNWGFFWRFFSEQFSYLVAESTQKWFFHQNNVRNVFSNIELPFGYNIMTLEYVLERTWKEIAKNMWKKFKFHHFQHFFGGGCCNSSMATFLKY